MRPVLGLASATTTTGTLLFSRDDKCPLIVRAAVLSLVPLFSFSYSLVCVLLYARSCCLEKRLVAEEKGMKKGVSMSCVCVWPLAH